MSERGVFAVDRGIFTDDKFADEPFTEREAFLWLVAEAAWKPRRMRSGATVVDLSRGQLCHSVRFMAEAWRWSKSRVDRFLSKLERWDTIGRTGGTATSVITVCGYDKIQRVALRERDSDMAAAGQQRDTIARAGGTAATPVTSCESDEFQIEALPERDSDGTASAPDAGQQRDKRESIKTQISLLSDDEGGTGDQATQDKSKKPARHVEHHLEKFEEFRRIYPAKHVSFPTQMARKRWVEAMKRGEDPHEILVGARAYAAEQMRAGNVGTKFIKGADAWLYQQAWKDFIGKQPNAMTPGGQSPEHRAYLASLTDDDWRRHVQGWRRTGGQWLLAQRTAPPDDPRTLVPRRILDEFEISSAGAPRQLALVAGGSR